MRANGDACARILFNKSPNDGGIRITTLAKFADTGLRIRGGDRGEKTTGRLRIKTHFKVGVLMPCSAAVSLTGGAPILLV